jgi:type I restriction enzyme S subunit
MSKDKLIPELRFPEFKNEGEWESNLLEEITISESSSMALNKLELKSKGYPVYGADSIVGYIDDFQQDEKYISIVKDGSGVGRLNLCQSHSSILGTLACIKSKNEKQFHLDWIYYLLNTIDFSVYVKGAGIPHIYYSDFKLENVPIPSIKEQQKIASCLSSLDEVIAAHSQKLELLKDHKKGLMQNLFPQEGEKVPKVRFKEFEKDGVWVENKLGELGEFLGGGTPSRTNSEYWSGNIPWISSSDISEGDIHNISISQHINEISISESATKIIPKGSILFVSRVGVGKLAVNNEKLCTSQDFTNFIPTEIVNYYVAYYFLANKILLQLLSQGTSIKGFSKSDLEDSKISFPKNHKEQQKIASCLSSLDTLITAEAEKIEQLKLHKKGLMQGLFPKIND